MSSKPKKTTFNEKWLLDPAFSSWLRRVEKDPYSAYCSTCCTSFALSNMGKQSVISHMRGRKHTSAVSIRTKSASLKVFFRSNDETGHDSGSNNPIVAAGPSGLLPQNPPESAPVITPVEDSGHRPVLQPPRGLQAFVLNDNVTIAEITWCLHVIMHYHSVRSSASTVPVFKTMFPDSVIARKVQLGRTKIGYTLLYGIAPFFQKELLDICTNCSHLVVGFDESHNKIVQKGQMDVSIRFWNSKSSEVCVRYFGSAFLGHATAEDLLKGFTETLREIDLKKLLQVSMDGPNVNLKFHKDLQTYLHGDPDDPTLLQIGSCGLHALHNAFKQGMNATDWNVVSFLRALHNLFNHVPARRADYTHYSGCDTFPLKFCAIRWLENAKVAERAISILPNIIKYVDAVKKNKRTPTCNSFKIVATAIEDKMLGPKLSFFRSLASDVEPFLRKFQSDAPLVPLLYGSLMATMRTVMSRFVKAEIIESGQDLSKVDLTNKENLIAYKNVDLGFATRDTLRRTHGLKDRDILDFRRDCRKAMEALCQKLLQRSPLKFKLTKVISFRDPQVAAQSSIRDKYLATTLEIFVEHKWLSGIVADKVQRQFKDLCAVSNFLEALKTFSDDERLDHFWFRTIFGGSKVPEELSSFLKMIFILSHGNASLERGFSINKECFVENLAEESLVAQRQIYDAIIANGGLDSVSITKPLILSARNAHHRYMDALKKRRTEADAKKIESQERKRAAIRVKELSAKKRKVLEDASKEATLIEAEIQTLRQ